MNYSPGHVPAQSKAPASVSLPQSKWELALPLAAVVVLLISCALISSTKYFWNDELFSYYMTAEPSFDKMVTAFHDKLNNTPFVYFLVGWSWDKLFGSSELSLRLFTSLGMCAALLITWQAIRRQYDFWSTSIGTLLVFCTSNILLYQNAEARMYGLYLAISAVAFSLYARFYAQRRLSLAALVLHALVHAAFVHTHLFGIFYSGAILVSFLVTDRLYKVFRPKLYLSILAGWASLVLYMPAFVVQADAGNPRTWIPAPDLLDLVDIYNISTQSFASRSLLLVLVLLLGYFAYRSDALGSYFSRYVVAKSEIPLLVFGLMFFVTPVLVWVVSLTIKPVFYPRYMIPSAIGWAILLAFFISCHLPRRQATALSSDQGAKSAFVPRGIGQLLLGAFVLVCLARPIKVGLEFRGKEAPGSHDIRPSLLAKYGHLPRVVTLSGDFLERNHYAPDRSRYFYILDWESAVTKDSGTFPPQEFKHMEAWKRNFPQLFANVATSADFLSRYDKFLVVDRPNYLAKCKQNHKGLHTRNLWDDYLDCPQWVEMRLLTNPQYKVTVLKNYKWIALLLVERTKAQDTARPL